MMRERRQNARLTQARVEMYLNAEQLPALLRGEQFGWRLWFVRNPLVPEPVPVLYNMNHDHVGILEPNGHIRTDVRLKIRAHENRYSELSLILRVSKSTENMAQGERRKGSSFLEERINDLLNPHQQRALRYAESSGWKLFCVRTSLFQKPVVIVVNSEGEIFAALEHDGEMNMTPDLSLRKEDWPAQIAKPAIGGNG